MANSDTYFHGITVLLVAALTAGCGQEPAERIDVHSHDGEPGSQSWIENSLPPEDRIRFRVAIDELGAPYRDILLDIDDYGDDWGRRLAETEAELLAGIDGKTAAEVIRMAEPAVSRRAEREPPELDALIAREAAARAARPELEKFTILDAKLVAGNFAQGLRPELELRVRNDTPYVVVSGEFRATLATPGRTLSWREEDFTEYLSGGIEPGEETRITILLEPGWDVTRADDAAVMAVATQALFGPGFTPLYPHMTKRDLERLKRLRALYTP